jgi:hypothetical protein|tara:strand:- start:284 stop:586 length:303 start_codon:yes stop_codon:yes gene_type:complete
MIISKRGLLDLILGFVIAAGTPLFIWTYLLARFPKLPSTEKIDPDLWSFLLFRVLLFSTLINFLFLVLGVFLKRMLMVKMILLVSLIYFAFYLYFRWEWL